MITPTEPTADVLICGGGPTGLLSAIMMAQHFPDLHIQLFDEQPMPPPAPNDETVWAGTDLDRYYLIGLGGRGISSLQEFGVWEAVQKISVAVPGRKEWNGKGNHAQPNVSFKTERKFTTHVLPRDRLVSVLNHHIIDCQARANTKEATLNYNYSNLSLNYGCTVTPIHIDNPNHVLVNVTKHQPFNIVTESKLVAVSLVIAADGSARTFANTMQHHDETTTASFVPFQVIRYNDDNQKVYKNIAFRIPQHWRNDINYAVRTNRVIFDALPANGYGDYVGVLLLRNDDPMARPNIDPSQFREILQEEIPQFIDYLDDHTVASAAHRQSSFLPMFRFVTPRMHHHQGQIVLLGDCAHTVKPYFGLGANSAMEDVKLLSRCIQRQRNEQPLAIDNNDYHEKQIAILRTAVCDFSDIRSSDIQTLVKVSYSLDRPGIEGVFTFLIPIILDGIFSKLLPQFFAPNIISMLQNEEITFQQAAQRKRIDRIGQVALLLLLLGISVKTVVIISSYY